MTIEVYTANIGGKDEPRDDIRVFADYDKFTLPVLNAKIYKILPHQYLDCDVSIWTDSNLYLNVPAEQVVAEWLGDADMAVFKHWNRESIYWEIKWIEYQFRHNKNSPILRDARAQVDHYRKIGVPKKTGMWNCGFIIRRHSPKMTRFNEMWWSEITRWSARDQVSFPKVKLACPEVKINTIEGDIRNHPYLTYKPHLIPS